MNVVSKYRWGFTIIELLVVVAIISVLASITLVNVTGYINKSKNAGIKANLSSALTNAAVFFDSNGTYTGYCADASYEGVKDAVNDITGADPTCEATDAAWCACSVMKVTTAEPANSTFCIDSSGYKKVTQNGGLCSTRCPSSGICVD